MDEGRGKKEEMRERDKGRESAKGRKGLSML